MADPFEVRLRFTNLLSHLSASATASIKTAHYALKHRDMDEDLHSCILENLERNNMNNRANIMYFLEHFCDMAIKEGHTDYVDMVRRDIERIVNAVAPRGGAGGANVKVVRRVVQELGGKGVLADEVVLGIEEGLKEREGERGGLLLGELPAGESDGGDVVHADGEDDGIIITTTAAATMVSATDAPADPNNNTKDIADLSSSSQKQQTANKAAEGESQRVTPRTGGGGVAVTKPNGVAPLRVDKRVIEQRIEEDRERNKRLRESVWAVGGGGGDGDGEELEKMWDEGSDLADEIDDDHVLAAEDADERKQAAKYAKAARNTATTSLRDPTSSSSASYYSSW